MRYGSGKYTYELVEPWAKFPDGESFVDVADLSPQTGSIFGGQIITIVCFVL
ncbi:MAG: hypothetical protein HQ580_08185 [Planctomycetes bacterium]|nr:hypothetical protein [Planctomycetota bacterium]